jgi:anti-sigma B factor antagonist
LRLARARAIPEAGPPIGQNEVVSGMSDQPFEIREANGLPVVTAPEEIDVANSGQLRSALLHAAAINPVVIVDMSGTDFCDSNGLSVLVRALRRVQADGGEVRLVVRTAPVLRILSITGVGSLFGVFGSVAEALSRPPPELAAAP